MGNCLVIVTNKDFKGPPTNFASSIKRLDLYFAWNHLNRKTLIRSHIWWAISYNLECWIFLQDWYVSFQMMPLSAILKLFQFTSARFRTGFERMNHIRSFKVLLCFLSHVKAVHRNLPHSVLWYILLQHQGYLGSDTEKNKKLFNEC